MTTLKTLKELRVKVEKLWTIELEARREAAAAEEILHEALKEYYDATQLEIVDLRRCEE